MATINRLFVVLTTVALGTACRPAPSGPLSAAAFRGDAATVKALLPTTSADTAADGWTPLMWAARAGQLETMTLLLDAGADPNRIDNRNGWTPLMHALHKQQAGAVRLLLVRGADGSRGARGTSPLEMAVLDNDVDLLRLLLASNPSREQKVRAFDLAVSGGALADLDRPLFGGCHTESVRYLLAADPSLVSLSETVGSPLSWARRQGCLEVVDAVTAANRANLAQKTP